MATDLPAKLREIMGKPLFPQTADTVVETSQIRFFASCVQDGAAEYWGDDPARIVAPPALLSTWNRPLMWYPERGAPETPAGLALHFIVKAELELPYGLVTEMETTVHAPVRPGIRVISTQSLMDVSESITNRLGAGRYWTIRVEYRNKDNNDLLGREDLHFFGYGKTRS